MLEIFLKKKNLNYKFENNALPFVKETYFISILYLDDYNNSSHLIKTCSYARLGLELMLLLCLAPSVWRAYVIGYQGHGQGHRMDAHG